MNKFNSIQFTIFWNKAFCKINEPSLIINPS